MGTPKGLRYAFPRSGWHGSSNHRSARYNSPIGMSRLADELIGMEYRRQLLQRREELSQSGDVLRIDAGIGGKNGGFGTKVVKWGKAWALVGWVSFPPPWTQYFLDRGDPRLHMFKTWLCINLSFWGKRACYPRSSRTTGIHDWP